MHPRQHYLEIALEKSINVNEFSNAVDIINAIQRTPGAGFKSFDASGQSFLIQALAVNATPIAKELLRRFKNDEDIILALDNLGNSAILIAVSKNEYEITTVLIEYTEQFQQGHWLLSNSLGNHILHYSTHHNDTKILDLILGKIKKDLNLILNKSNSDGDTALHEALTHQNLSAVAKLINAGAKLTLHNNEKITAFQKLTDLDFIQQLEVFNLLNFTLKQNLLETYKKAVIANPKDTNIKSVYFKFAGLVSLQQLLIAKHELNTDFAIKNVYMHTIDGQQEERTVPASIFSLIPRYKHAVEEIAKSLNIDVSETEEAEIKQIEKHLDEYDVLDLDRTTLQDLITSINIYLGDLQLRGSIPLYNRALALITPALCFAAGIALLIGLYYVGNANAPSESEENFKRWNISYAVFYGISCFVTLVLSALSSSALYLWYWNKQAEVDPKEWRNLIDNFNRNVIEKLQLLEKKQEERILPITKEELRTLESYTNDFRHQITLSRAIHIFTNLRDALAYVQAEMNKTQKSLTFFSPTHSVSEIKEITESRKGKEKFVAGLIENFPDENIDEMTVEEKNGEEIDLEEGQPMLVLSRVKK